MTPPPTRFPRLRAVAFRGWSGDVAGACWRQPRARLGLYRSATCQRSLLGQAGLPWSKRPTGDWAASVDMTAVHQWAELAPGVATTGAGVVTTGGPDAGTSITSPGFGSPEDVGAGRSRLSSVGRGRASTGPRLPGLQATTRTEVSPSAVDRRFIVYGPPDFLSARPQSSVQTLSSLPGNTPSLILPWRSVTGKFRITSPPSCPAMFERTVRGPVSV